MSITRTVTKKILENIVHETFSNFGDISSSSLLDSLKFLGFYYATNAGISINIEDLKTPDMKKDFLKDANDETTNVSEQWQQGFVSDTERFQTIIDSWNFATESLKDRIIDYYQNLDPANNLYIMAFSGARGNMSQVRQLVGMRGLMSDQEGNIIDLPIQANFREGLSSIDYIISSYGARKGIVDTALKTADSGYLTRRLIYIAQDLIIREIDCKTKNGVIVLLKSSTSFKNLIGRTLIAVSSSRENFAIKTGDLILTKEILTDLKTRQPLSLKIRSSLTCNSLGSICQRCYGWDLSKKEMISLGEAVGIIAAQSIGEPGTQLTMRTFHTGGIFTSELLKQTLSPFSGKITIPRFLKTVPYRTTHGIIVAKLQQEVTLIITDWKGKRKSIFLDIGSFLYITNSGFIKKNQLISEYSDRSIVPGVRRLKPIYSSLSGEIRYEDLIVRTMIRPKKNPRSKVAQDDGVVWVASGKILPLPKEAKYLEKKYLSKTKACAQLYIISPFSGIVTTNNDKSVLKSNTTLKNNLQNSNHYSTFKINISILTENKELNFDLNNLAKQFSEFKTNLTLLIKNYQYVDEHTILAIVNIFPKYNGEIYAIRQKRSNDSNILCLITEEDVWKINADQVNDFNYFPSKKTIIRSGIALNSNSTFTNSGFFLKRDGLKMVFQNALPVFLSRGTMLKYVQGNFILKNQVLASLVNYTQQTEDIVQGLPKIEELIEARIPKHKAYLSFKPGVFKTMFGQRLKINGLKLNGERLSEYSYSNPTSQAKINLIKLLAKKQLIEVFHNVADTGNNHYYFNHKLWNGRPLNENLTKKAKIRNGEYIFRSNIDLDFQLINKKRINSNWTVLNETFEEMILNETLYILKGTNNEYYFEQSSKTLRRDTQSQSYVNNDGEYLIKIKNGGFLYLEPLNPIVEYQLPLNSKVICKPGQFIDLGEPITEGVIDPHDLLNIFFQYHLELDGQTLGIQRSLNKFQLLMVNSIQAIYQSQGVNISSKHIEIIVRQMTDKVTIVKMGDTPLLPGELVRLSFMTEIYKMLKSHKNKNVFYNNSLPFYEPILLSTTRSSLAKDGFLSAAGFQETKRILSKAAIEGKSDWLRGLKECIILGRLIPAGSAFLNYKNYLDNIYLFKKNIYQVKK
jgi:hypothetical protein